MGCRNLLSGPNSNHRLETTVYKPVEVAQQLSYCVTIARLLLPQRAQILKNFKIALRDWNFQARLKRMTFSSEIENFKRGHPPNPYFCGGILKVKIEIFKRDWSFQARLKISSENLKFSSVQARLIFSRFGPSGFTPRATPCTPTPIPLIRLALLPYSHDMHEEIGRPTSRKILQVSGFAPFL